MNNYIYTYIYIYPEILRSPNSRSLSHSPLARSTASSGTLQSHDRLPSRISFFCKRALQKRLYSEKETCIFQKEKEKEKERERETEREKVREGHTRTHTHTNTHTSKRVHNRAHALISRCPLELGEVEGHAFIFIGLGCLEILHLFVPSPRTPCHAPRLLLKLFSYSTPTLSYLIFPLPFLSLFLFLLSCP